MEFISTKDTTPENAPSGPVLVQYLEPSWGSWSVEFAIAYYDNPKDYECAKGEGWLLWFNSKPINVIAYAHLPEPLECEDAKLKQPEFEKKYGSYHPNLGSIGE